jgi:dTDP-glucose 4,6-dehydratase/UDP-glucuronate decarboxylase
MRILVAGGAGFVGSNLCRVLLDSGNQVDCVDNFATGRRENVADLLDRSAFRLIEGDICDLADLWACQSQSYSEIYNLACPTGVPNIAILGEEMLSVCSVGSFNLLRIAKACNARYLFASTAEAYGDPQVIPQPETYVGHVDPVGPRSPYEEGKRFGEALTAYYARKRGVHACIIRIFNTYGRAMSPSDPRVVPQLLFNLAAGRPFIVYGDGQQTRSFLHVNDMVAGMLLVMERGEPGTVYNVGADDEMTILELHRHAEAAVGKEVPLEFRRHFINDHSRRRPDTTRLRALGWRETVPLRAGLRDSYNSMLARGLVPQAHLRPARARPQSVDAALVPVVGT